MNRFISSMMALAILPAFVIQYEAKTGLSDNWNKNRALIEQRVKLVHTNQSSGEFHEINYKVNIAEIGKYNAAYKCNSGKDVSKCIAPRGW